jgi:minor extracellular serine protease Vpr
LIVLRRLLTLVVALSLLAPAAATAQEPGDRFEPAPTQGTIDPQVVPMALDDSRAVTVMVQMSGDPVAVVQARRPDRQLSAAEKDAIADQLKERQDAITDAIEAKGGRVLAQLQSAYNGIKVRIARNAVPALAELPNVVAIRGVQQQTIGNATSVPYLGVPEVWDILGFTGAAVRVAVIDTGIDYTHANFGGPGTVAAFELADENDTTLGDAGDDGIFGETGTSKVKGGFDFVGDDYDASADDGDPALIPQPDPDPLDCHGHGSHVAGTAAGFGVLDDGSTYSGPYDETTHSNDFNIGPGVAPEAELYALRVFGCGGSTDVTVEAIDWAVAHNMDIINMSLGSPFGRADDPSAVAATNAAAAGVVVVASAGNSGSEPYITGAPAAGVGAISVAAVDSNEFFDGVDLDLDTGESVTALAANGIVPPDGTSYDIVVLENDPGTPENEALGCSPEAFANQPVPVAGALAVTLRGACARVARAIYGQQAGAAAVAMINTDPGYPPYEGPITSNPDTGESFEVTIPFLGIRGVLGPNPTQDGDHLVEAESVDATTLVTIPNPGFRGFASFSSGGPTNGDSSLKPDVAAPGVSILSTGVGTGNQGSVISGTSMAAPHVAGVAALVREAHPTWSAAEVKAAITNSGDEAGLPGYRVTRAGSGLVTPLAAASTEVVALGDLVAGDTGMGLSDFHTSNLSFGFAELGANYSATQTVTVRNLGTSEVTLTPSFVPSSQSAPATITFGAGSVTVGPGLEATLDVTLQVPAATVDDSSEFREVSGNVELAGGDLTLRVPYLLVPRALSTISTAGPKLVADGKLKNHTVTNPSGVIAGTADVFQWGLQDANDVDEAVLGGSGYDVRAAGVQSFPLGDAQAIVFAINTHDRWSNAAVNEYDVLIDTGGSADPEWAVVGFDFGALTAGSFNGLVGSFVFNLATGTGSIVFLADAPTDSGVILLPILASQIGLTPTSGGFRYSVETFSLEGAGTDVVAGTARFDPWAPALLGDFPFETVDPGAAEQIQLGLHASRFAAQQPLGAMVVSTDNASGAAEAQLIAGSAAPPPPPPPPGPNPHPFQDVAGNPFAGDIQWAWENGVTRGCSINPPLFCPSHPVTREQMASFLVRTFGLPPSPTDFFSDDNNSIHEGAINALAQAGITGGCGPGRYCPRDPVLREQMASFLVRALRLPPSPTDFFSDDNNSIHEGAINALRQAGVTGGCGPGRYCPRNPVLRDQMVAFLHRADRLR